MIFSKKVFCGATRPLRPPGILSVVWPVLIIPLVRQAEDHVNGCFSGIYPHHFFLILLSCFYPEKERERERALFSFIFLLLLLNNLNKLIRYFFIKMPSVALSSRSPLTCHLLLFSFVVVVVVLEATGGARARSSAAPAPSSLIVKDR